MLEALGNFYRQQSCELSTPKPQEAKPPAVLDSDGVSVVIQQVIRQCCPAWLSAGHDFWQ